MADHNVEGQVALLVRLLGEGSWAEFWAELAVEVETFQALGLDPSTLDSTLWCLCQQRQAVLITANRNQQGPDSLEATIRLHNTPDSLPVLTLADATRIQRSATYADRVAVQLLEYLFRIDRLRGTGRLYLP
jgi:hypothetical protein